MQSIFPFLLFPSLLFGAEMKQGSDGNAVAYPGIFSGWTTSEGSDGRMIAHPGIFSGWTTSEGNDGRLIAHPSDAFVRQGNNGRLLAYYFYTDDSMKDVRQLIVDQIREEEGSNLDALWILKTMGHLDEDYASSNSSYSEGYQAGYSKGESDATIGALDTAFFLIDQQLQSHNLSLSTLEDDLNRTKLDFFRGGYDAASEELISEIKSNPSAYDLFSAEDLNASIIKAHSDGIEKGKLIGKTEGETLVISDPSAYRLVTKSSYDQALLDANTSAEQAIADAKVLAMSVGQTAAIDMVKANPSTYGLYSSADMNASLSSALSDANASAEQAIADAKVLAKAEGIEEGKTLGKSEVESSVTSNPSAYNLVTQSAYDEMMNELMSASNGDTTPYSEGWFYLPNQGWLWTTRTTYPYFFDSTTKAWMYFQSGNDKPRFYHYGTKEWMMVE